MNIIDKMKKHVSSKNYKVTIEEIVYENKEAAEKLSFEAESHDDIFKIVEMLKQSPDFDSNDAAALGVGLKLFTGVMMKQKDNPIFKELLPHFKDFMKELKSAGKGNR